MASGIEAIALSQEQEEINLCKRILSFKYDPLGFTRWAFPWGSGDLEDKHIRSWQEDIMEVIGDHIGDPETRFQPLRIAVCSGHGIGKELAKSTIVNCPEGIKRWGDVRVGDSVFGGNGKPTKVKAVHEQGVKPIYRVKFDDGSFCMAGLEHRWNVRGRQERRNGLSGWRTLSTSEIIKLGVLRPNGVANAKQWEIPVQGAAEFAESPLPLHPYAMGIWLGDGRKGEPVYSKPFKEIADRIRSFGVALSDHADGDCHGFLGVGKLFSSGAFALGSPERYIPDEYKFNSTGNRKELLRGLLDSDGEANSCGSVGFGSTSKRLVEDVIWLVRSLGGKAMMQDAVKHGWYPGEDGERIECRDCYRATINLDWNPFTIEHRRKAWKLSEERYLKRWIESIEYSHDEEAMCITVEAEDGLYLANDFIVTHNSSLIGMLLGWAQSTCVDSRAVVTANTGGQLDTKTVPEVEKWYRRLITSHWWQVNATSIRPKDKDHEKTWRTDFVTWSAKNAQAFAGLHNAGKIILIIFDEASEIDDIIWETIQGAMSDEGTIIIWLAFGNPTKYDGRFAECFGKFKHRWVRRQIDAREVEGTNKELIAQDIADWGEDSDFVRVRWRGIFPRAGAGNFIPPDAVEVCRKFKAEGYDHLPKIMAVDVARFGDDQSVIGTRQGRKAKILKKYRGLDTKQLSDRVAEQIEIEQPDAVVIDGDGIGAGVVDNLRAMDYKHIHEHHGNAEPLDGKKYFNKRAEVWGLYRDAIMAGMDIPDDPELIADSCDIKYGFSSSGQIQLESKKDMKARGKGSPDCGDTISMTFGVKVVAPRPKHEVKKYVYPSQQAQAWMG